MSEENDSWLETTLGISIPTFLGGAANEARGDAGAPPPTANSDGNGQATSPPPPAAPAPAGDPASAVGADAPSLEERYLTELAKPNPNWQLVAELLNGFSPPDIQSRLDKLTKDQVTQIYIGAASNPRVGPNSNVAQMTFSAAPEGTPESSSKILDEKYNAAKKAEKWDEAAEFLNGFSIEDIKIRLGDDSALMANLHKGALANPRVGPNSNIAQLTKGAAGSAATIEVKANGDGSFTVTGSGFTQQFVTVRAADDFLNNRFFPTQSKDGKIELTTPRICVQEGPIHFSVLAGTFPLVSDLLSNFAHSTCGPQPEPEKKEDEPEEPSDKPENGDDPAPQQTIPATIENADIIKDIILTVTDLNANQVILNRVQVNANTRVAIKLQADKDGRGKIHWAALTTDAPAGTLPKEDTVERITADQNISTGLH